MANYVKFRRGTPEQFAALIHKDNDTLYFITEPDSLDGALYLGSKLIAGGDGIDVSLSLEKLSDVIIDAIQDKDFLMYDSVKKAWINATVDEVFGTYVGATENSSGVAGLVPPAEVAQTNAFLRSDGKWVEISASQNITTIENDSNKTHQEIMFEVNNADNPFVDDILIIKDVIANGKYQHTAYVYNGSNWEAMDGNYNAENVYFKNDFIFTEAVGTVEIPESGNVTVAAAGKNVKEFITSLFSKEENPMISEPTVDIVLNAINSTHEVGSTYAPGYTIVFNKGSYQYGPDTGVEEVQCSISDAIGNTSSAWTKTFDEVTISDNFEYDVEGTVTYSDGVIPQTNLGNPYEEGKILGKTINVKSKNKVRGHRNSFYGALTNKEEDLNSNIIRSLTASNRNLTNGSSFSVNIPVGTKRVIIAYPSHLQDLTSVKDINALNSDIVSSFKKRLVQVEGFNGYKTIEYKVYVLDYAFGSISANIYQVTI